jgi:putative hemolysin
MEKKIEINFTCPKYNTQPPYNLLRVIAVYIMQKLFCLKNFLFFMILTGTFIFFFSLHPVCSYKNPSAVYCSSLGYGFKIIETTEGEVGMCVFPDNTSVDAWNFLSGKEALKWSYCAKEGYGAKHVVNMETCKPSDECTICVLPNGTEIEVTKLMGLTFEEGVCGDGICVIGENYNNCPEDCPSGSYDGYCDRVKDGKCDPDCEVSADQDCLMLTTTTTTLPVEKPPRPIYIYLIFVGVIVAIIIFFLYKIRVVG